MRKLLPLVLATLFVSGCGLVYRQPIFQGNLLEKTAVDQLQAGMDQRQVMMLLGTPSIEDPFHHDRWDYVASQRIGRTGAPVVKTMTLWFENGQLARWEGEYFPEQDETLANNSIRYFGPNLAKDKDKKKRGR
ncbi:outer membrane protein assembly factor BamE [Thermomonas sp.]|uniref:outer membrane protein assembly factor BamE n=1 Tax=Thermomonas sp. TaxID=1971895 RepID=UPI001AC0EF9D|nr:outer membrane protein assembly factor BamE [Xanthomonadales bacterium]MBN8794860.1 outer membrane protein assembly factor BamE [Stenotrophomonas nitritireducens]